MTNDLQKIIQILEDMESIKKLKATYCYLADAGIAGNLTSYDELMNCFVDDSWVDFPGFGRQQGKDAVAQFFRETVHSLWSYAAHMAINPVIDVDGDQARGTWSVHVACTTRTTNKALWVQGKYSEEYVKVQGDWRWKSITFAPDFFTPFEEGWVKTPFVDLAG